MVLPTLQSALKDGFGEAVTMPEPCKFLSLDSSHKKLLWAHKEADLAPYPVTGLAFRAGDVEKFPQALSKASTLPADSEKRIQVFKSECLIQTSFR